MAKKNNNPITPREFISPFRDLVGDAYLIKLFKLSTHPESGRRSLNHWTAQIPYVDEESVRENWIEKHERLMKRLLLQPGGMEIARNLVARHADIVDCDLVSRSKSDPDKATVEEECLDDYPGLIDFHTAIRDKKPLSEIKYLLAKTKRELDETLTIYRVSAEIEDEL